MTQLSALIASAAAEAIAELCNPDAHISERIAAADALRKAVGMPTKHADDCAVNAADFDGDGNDCTCAYWDAPSLAAPVAPAEPGWQPIETAPTERKLGQWTAPLVRVWLEDREAYAFWDDNRHAKKPRPFWHVREIGAAASRERQGNIKWWLPLACEPPRYQVTRQDPGDSNLEGRS